MSSPSESGVAASRAHQMRSVGHTIFSRSGSRSSLITRRKIARSDPAFLSSSEPNRSRSRGRSDEMLGIQRRRFTPDMSIFRAGDIFGRIHADPMSMSLCNQEGFLEASTIPIRPPKECPIMIYFSIHFFLRNEAIKSAYSCTHQTPFGSGVVQNPGKSIPKKGIHFFSRRE